MPGTLLCCLACQAHRTVPLDAVLLRRSVRQALKGAPWMGSYSVVQCLRHLMGQPLYCSAALAGMWREREATVMALPATCDSAVLPCFLGCLVSSTGISHHNLLPHNPSICFSAVHSSSLPGIAPQSLNPSSQLLHLPGDQCPCPGYVWLRQGLSDSRFI